MGMANSARKGQRMQGSDNKAKSVNEAINGKANKVGKLVRGLEAQMGYKAVKASNDSRPPSVVDAVNGKD